MPLRVVFLGTPEFAVPTFHALGKAGHSVVSACTQPPRPAGRGHQPQPSPVQVAAADAGVPVRTPATLKDKAEQDSFAALGCDVGVVVAYGLLLPPAILAAPRLGCINLHASLLPRWRGAAPIAHAILAGDPKFGVTTMQMDAGLDTGPILLQEEVDAGPRPNAGALHGAMAARGAELMVRTMAGLESGTLAATPQPATGATTAPKFGPADAHIDWRRPADEIDRQVRAFAPRPGAWFDHDGTRLRVTAAVPVVMEGAAGAPGEVLDATLTVACGTGALAILEIQRPGKQPMPVPRFLRGYAVAAGTRFPVPVP